MDIKWKSLFSREILKRGENYYLKDRVIRMNSSSESGIYNFMVFGSSRYKVSITVEEHRIASMQCHCPYAREGRRCKHMAAALFELEENGDLKCDTVKTQTSVRSAKKRVRVFPFRNSEKDSNSKNENSEKAYSFYNFDKISADYEIYEDTLQEAKQLILLNRVKLVSIEEGFIHSAYSMDEPVCRVSGTFEEDDGDLQEVDFLLGRNNINNSSCFAKSCTQEMFGYSYRYPKPGNKLCEHKLALLILAKEFIEKKNLGDATDRSGLMLLHEYRAKRRKNMQSETRTEQAENTIKLEPRFEILGKGDFSVSFRVGVEKLYLIKNLTDFVNSVEAKEEMKLGTKNSISFASNGIEENSKELYRFIKNEVKTASIKAAEASLYYGRNYATEIGSNIALYGRTLDEFYCLMDGKSFPFLDKSTINKKIGEAVCGKNSPKIKLSMKAIYDDDGSFDGIEVDGKKNEFADGADYKYFFDGSNLNRIAEDELGILRTFWENEYSSQICFKVGRRNLSEFYYKVLPLIKETADVKIKDFEEIQKYLYPQPEFVFSLDAENGMLLCDVKVQYGEKIHRITGAEADEAGYELYRDLNAEKEVLDKVKEYFPDCDEKAVFYCGEDDDMQYRVLENGVNELMRFGEVFATERFKRITVRRQPQMTVGVRMESELLNLTISSTELSNEELLEILYSYQRKKKYHRLRNGDFIQLEEKALGELSNLMKLVNAAPEDFVKGDMKVPAYRALYLDKLLEKNDALYAKRDSNFKHLVKEFKTVTDSEYELPESLQNIARNYQEFGYKWLRTIEAYRFGGILADDMGLGKTLQLISVLLAAKQENRLGTALIVTPASLVYNWKEEFAKFAPETSVKIAAGSKDEREAIIQNAELADVLITSYDLLKRDILLYSDKMFTYQVIDEAQYIKTHTTAAAKSVKAINSKIRFALTGTPIENRLSELWSIFDFLMPGYLYTYEQFRNEFELQIMKNHDESALSSLKRLVEPFILRRLKQDVLKDLPEKIEEICYVNFDTKQQQIYDGQALHMKKMLEGESDESFQKNKIAILAEITKIRQICCDPSLCLENYEGGSAKMETCTELIKSAIDGGHKILVFSQFKSLLELLAAELKKEKIANFMLTGETKKEERIDLVNRFNNDDTSVFLISLKAGGTGLNLTGADIVIHFDPWWNIAAQNQATDRAHRIGQTRTVSVYKLIVKNSIEEKILKMQQSKNDLADEILSGNTGGLMSMSKDELLQLL